MVLANLEEPTQTETVKGQHHITKEGKCLAEEKDITARWTRYCSELYNHQIKGDPNVLAGQESSHEDDFPTMCEEVAEAIQSLKNGKAAEINNIPAELIKHGGN